MPLLPDCFQTSVVGIWVSLGSSNHGTQYSSDAGQEVLRRRRSPCGRWGLLQRPVRWWSVPGCAARLLGLLHSPALTWCQRKATKSLEALNAVKQEPWAQVPDGHLWDRALQIQIRFPRDTRLQSPDRTPQMERLIQPNVQKGKQAGGQKEVQVSRGLWQTGGEARDLVFQLLQIIN